MFNIFIILAILLFAVFVFDILNMALKRTLGVLRANNFYRFRA